MLGRINTNMLEAELEQENRSFIANEITFDDAHSACKRGKDYSEFAYNQNVLESSNEQINLGKKRHIQSESDTASSKFALYEGNISYLPQERCISRAINFKPSQSQENKTVKRQVYRTVSLRKFWIRRSYPNGCGRNLEAIKFCIAKDSRDVENRTAFLEEAEQEEKPFPTEQVNFLALKMKVTARKSNARLKDVENRTAFLQEAEQEEKPFPTEQVNFSALKMKLTARKSNARLKDVENRTAFLEEAEQEEKPFATEQVNFSALKMKVTARKSNARLKQKIQEKKQFLPPCKSYFPDRASSRDRDNVKTTLRLFQALCRSLLQEWESKPVDCKSSDTAKGKHMRVDLRAFTLIKQKHMLTSGKPLIGNVKGIEVGDEFHYRVELCLTGLHKPPMAGIDFANIDGRRVATSIVSSGMYSDEQHDRDVLVYEGEGGGFVTSKNKMKPHPGDQKPVRGNLALMNSKSTQYPVRVIFGFKEQKPGKSRDGVVKALSTYVYDGLYTVEDYWPETGKKGFSVFKFKLRRIPNQPQIPLKKLKENKVRFGLCLQDISMGNERKPIPVVNSINKDLPSKFRYMSKMIYPSWYRQIRPQGCDCIGECVDSTICICAAKNGGNFPFNYDGAIVRQKSLVYECGPACRCSSSCHNRVSQHGIKHQFEIFKTETRGWGVRSLVSIPSGGFVCEYTGELLAEKEAQERACDDYLFAIGNNYIDEELYEGLSTFLPGLEMDNDNEETGSSGYVIDAAKCGGVGRFINHSCAPNLYAQNVLFDHDDKNVPHIMFFAVENIPPVRELSYHYNYAIDQVHDLEGKIKRKACFCGAAGCSGRLY